MYKALAPSFLSTPHDLLYCPLAAFSFVSHTPSKLVSLFSEMRASPAPPGGHSTGNRVEMWPDLAQTRLAEWQWWFLGGRIGVTPQTSPDPFLLDRF